MQFLKQTRLYRLGIAMLITAVTLIILCIFAFCYTARQKQGLRVDIITTAGDASVLDDITLDGVLWKPGYQASFSITGQQAESKINTLQRIQNLPWQYQFSIPAAFENELSSHNYFIDETSRTYLLAENATETLYSQTQDTDLSQWEIEDGVAVFENVYHTDVVVPAFCFAENSSTRPYSYGTGQNDFALADYTIPANADGWQLEYTQREYQYPEFSMEQEEPRWTQVTEPDRLYTNYMQMVACSNGEVYFTLPTLSGAVGQNGIYRKTDAEIDSYIWVGKVEDLNDAATKVAYEAQREAIYTYSIQGEGGAVRRTCALVAHKELLFLLTSQTQADAQAELLMLTVVEPTSGTVVQEMELGCYPIQPDTPAMFYQNQGYLSLAVATPAEYLVWSFCVDTDIVLGEDSSKIQRQPLAESTKTSAVQLVDTVTFAKQYPAVESALQDVYFDGKTLYIMETSQSHTDVFTNEYSADETSLNYYATQRMLAFQAGVCVWEGALSTDLYQDYLHNYSRWNGVPRIASNFKFHQKGEARV